MTAKPKPKTKEEKPRYPHDCGVCTFLGAMDEFDLYHCTQDGLFPTVIARYGLAGCYISGMVFATRVPQLREARQRALKRGLQCEPLNA